MGFTGGGAGSCLRMGDRVVVVVGMEGRKAEAYGIILRFGFLSLAVSWVNIYSSKLF